MKKLLTSCSILTLVFALLFVACSSDDDDNNPTIYDPPELADNPDFTIEFPETWEAATYNIIDTVRDVDGTPVNVQAVRLKDLVMMHLDELKALVSPGTHDDDSSFVACFTYAGVGSDGFTGHGRVNNMKWEELCHGYVEISSGDMFYNIDMTGKHRIRVAVQLDLYKTITVMFETGDTELDSIEIQFELTAMDLTTHANSDEENEDAIAFADFIYGYVTETPDQFNYVFKASDDYFGDAVSYEQLQTGYILMESYRTIFDDPGLDSGAYKLRNPNRIVLQ